MNTTSIQAVSKNSCGLRVGDLLTPPAAGAPDSEILEDYPYLEREDIAACLLYAARCVDDPRFAA